jgi:16S rRNA C1402 (ribose-2'-O) methylase RsmI
MTKVHEEYIRGTAEDVLARLTGRNETIGEFSVYISGNSPV